MQAALMTLRLKVAELERGTWVALQAVLTLVAVLLTTVFVTVFVEAETRGGRALLALGALTVIVLHGYLTAVMNTAREARFPRHPQMVLSMTRAVVEAMATENRRIASNVAQSADAIALVAIGQIELYLAAIERAISQAWSQQQFGEATQLEVVLMTKARDGHVTVAAWASNRPRSLELRSADPSFYGNTEAAKLYRAHDDQGRRAPVWIIPDVSKDPTYDHFGRDPSIRTNSTALLPLYDSESRLHGFVAITARRRVNLFREEDRGFWEEVWRLWEPNLLRHVLTLEGLGLQNDWTLR